MSGDAHRLVAWLASRSHLRTKALFPFLVVDKDYFLFYDRSGFFFFLKHAKVITGYVACSRKKNEIYFYRTTRFHELFRDKLCLMSERKLLGWSDVPIHREGRLVCLAGEPRLDAAQPCRLIFSFCDFQSHYA